MKYLPKFLTAFLMGGLMLSAPVFAADFTVSGKDGDLTFSGSQVGKVFEGKFQKYNGTIAFDPAHPEKGQAKITINMASAVTNDPQRDNALPGHDWFDVKTFPTAIFQVNGFKPKGGNLYDAEGTLTIKNISKPVTLPLTLNLENNSLHAQGSVKLVRSAFNVGLGPWTSGQWVGLDVNVGVNVTAHSNSSSAA